MNSDLFLNIGGPHVIHEDFGDEVVVVHLETGRYYSFNQTGSEIWNRVSHGILVKDLIDWMMNNFAGDAGRLEAEVKTFLEQLQEETLVAPFPAPVQPAASGKSFEEKTASEKAEFQTPQMEKFTDMQDLLLLDPIHEVDEAGWPHPMEEAGGGKKE